MKKVGSQSRKVHIHFDQKDDDFPTQDGEQISITEQLVKRQNQLLQQQRHESIIKKPKIDQQQVSNHIKTLPKDSKKLPDFTTLAQSIIEDKKQTFKQTQEDTQLFQQQTMRLLTEFLFHPNRNNQCIINNQIANQWILKTQTSLKLKSYLILYMILYQFEDIQFKFTKIHELQGQKYHKQIHIQKTSNLSPKNQSNQSQYQKFKQNQLRKYLSEYFQWLILKYEGKFEIGKQDMEFWAMALNKRQELANQLTNSKNIKERSRNVYLSNFLMNAQDPLYCATVQRPTKQKIILNMTRQDLQRLPLCHWVLGVNFSIRYFFKKLFQDRIRESLNPNNIDKLEIQQFYHEYQLLCKYFKQSLPSKSQFSQSHKHSLGDRFLQWISLESCISNKDESEIIKLNKSICTQLLQRAVQDYKNNVQQAQHLILTAFQLLERQSTLKVDKKQNLISQILYSKPGIAIKLGKNYQQIISKLQSTKQAQIPQFFQLLNMKYNKFYRHLLLSQQPSIKNDFLAQLKHLIEIDIKMQDIEVKQRIRLILTSFNIITHWNKNILKAFIFLIQKYSEKLFNSKNDLDEKSQKERNKQLIEIKSLLIFLKIHLRLQPFNFKNLKDLCEFVQNAQKGLTILEFQQKTVRFIKKDILSILFNKHQLNQTLLSETKKDYISGSKGQSEEINKSKKTTVLEKLASFSTGIDYFKNQIQFLKKEASLLTV